MSAYIIAKVEVTDMEQYKNYMKLTPAAIEAFGGKFIARGGEVETLEGPEETRRVVLLEFPNLEAARAFWTSEQYAEAKAKREGAAEGSFVLVDGV